MRAANVRFWPKADTSSFRSFPQYGTIPRIPGRVRREFIRLASATALAWPLGARAQEPGRIYRLAIVTTAGRDEATSLAFLDELRVQGFVEGKNLEFVSDGFQFDNEKAAAVVPAIIRAAPADVGLRGLNVSFGGNADTTKSCVELGF